MSMRLESKRLIVRGSIFKDCKLFTEWEEKPYIKEFFTISDGRNYEEITREFILREQDPTVAQLTIVNREDSRTVGRFYLSRIDRYDESLDITRVYIGEEEYRGKGLGREAMELILKHCFEERKLHRVTLDHFTGNERAAKLYQKLGFQYEGVARGVCKKNGHFVDLHLMSMLSDEYEEAKAGWKTL